MIKKEKNIGIFIDSRKKSGGAYQELLYTIQNIKKNNQDNFKFVIICTSKELDINLGKKNL